MPGRIAPPRSVPQHIPRPEYVGRPAPARYTGGDRYSAEEIARIRTAGALAADAIAAVGAAVAPGVTTDELDGVGHDYLVERGAYPSTLGYRGYPKSICSSINEVICHGIPDDTVLEAGDIVNIDITAYLDGVHGDSNVTFIVGGETDSETTALVERTRESLRRGIAAARPGREVNIIGRAIQSYAQRFGYGVVRDFTGHGVGRAFHTGLIIPHYDAPQFDTVIEETMVFTIEPMLTLGTHEWEMWDDGWTVVTRDRSRTAQFEHTLAILADGTEILTEPSTAAVDG